MKPKALKLHKIAGLELISEGEDQKATWRYGDKYEYKWRDKWEDKEKTKAFFDEYPPEVGDLVVVLHTASGYRMMRPDVKPIIAITKQKRLVVDHIHEGWAGKAFWRTGQNCKAPRGQCWLVPAELYRDIPVDPKALRLKTDPPPPSLSVSEMAKAYGGADKLVKELGVLTVEYGLTKEEAMDELRQELKNEAVIRSRGGKNLLGGTVTRKSIQDHNRHFLQSGKARKDLQRKREGEMISKGQARGYSRLKNRFGG
jgi:hypothetical protein